MFGRPQHPRFGGWDIHSKPQRERRGRWEFPTSAEVGIKRRLLHVEAGDVLLMAGGTLVHGSPKTPKGAPTRFATYADFRPMESELE